MTLLAKSSDRRLDPEGLTLAGHSLRVARVAAALFKQLGPRLREMFQLPEDELPELGRWIAVAGLLHDIGKCSASFQAMVTSEQPAEGGRHPYLHEFLSTALVASETELGEALSRALDPGARALVAASIAAHHLRARPGFERPRAQRGEQLAFADPDLLPVWKELKRLVGASIAPRADLDWAAREIQQRLVVGYTMDGQDALESASPAMRRALGVAKSLVIAADVVGSAVPEDDVSLERWVERSCTPVLTPEDLHAIVKARLGDATPRAFQSAVADSRDRATLVTAGCGNGKTLAAYLWARRHAAGRCLVFCYPTTGTASAGFSDYLLGQSDLERALLHSRASVDIAAMQRSPEEDEALELWAPDVLERWGKKVVACTVDAGLACFANVRSGLATLPLLARSAFVFDEIHSYDRRLFGALLTFLQNVHAPVLLMTASLGEARRKALDAALGRELVAIEGDPAIEGAARYLLEPASNDGALEAVGAALARGERVLWVANTVARAQRVLDQAAGSGNRALLYHSRFRYEDRVNRQNQVVTAFRSSERTGQLVVATQVCEMSLDISADLMVTEWAPLPSLVQRLGRLNRRDPVPEGARRCLLVEPERALPYSNEQLAACRTIIEPDLGRPLSQADLARLLAQLEEGEYVPVRLPFFHDLTMTNTAPLRDGSRTLTFVRQEDVPSLSAARRADIVKKSIPMLEPRKDWQQWPRLRGAIRAPAGTIDYSVERGASWAS